MNCESTRKQFALFLYGELSFEDEELVSAHLDECDGCRRKMEREKRIHCAVEMAEMRPSAELLERCRLELPRTLRKAGRPARTSPWMERLRGLFASPAILSPAWLRAVALVALGFFGARYAPAPQGSSEGPVATTVRYVEPSDAGQVRIVVDETRQRVLSGSLEDDRIQNLLLTAVRDPSDPGVQSDSIGLLKYRADSQETKNALLYVLEHDPNDGVRLKALEGLRAYATEPQSRQVLSRVLLSDGNPGIRSLAIELLVDTDQTDVVETLQELMRKEDNSYVRMRSQQALEEMNASVETF